VAPFIPDLLEIGLESLNPLEVKAGMDPIEIKKHADPTKSDVLRFSILDKIPNVKRGQGGVICLYDHLVTLNGNDRTIPVELL